MNLKDKLVSNIATIGTWLTIGHPSVAEVLSSAGFEWIVIDLEHSSIDLEQAQVLITTIQSKGVKALVRVSKNEEVVIKRVLDAGADGIIVPMVNSKTDAIAAVSYSKYPPFGSRGVGLFRAQNYGQSFDGYKKWVENELVIIAQIEHIDAVNNIEEIISVDGVDGVIIGPYDLSSSMGYPGDFDKEEVSSAIQKTVDVCRKKNFPVGFHVIESSPDKLIQRLEQGCTFLAYSLDFFFLGDSARSGMEKIKEVM